MLSCAQSASEYYDADERYRALWVRYRAVCADAHSDKNRLLEEDWRSLTDKDFEYFLKDVFETLGYKVKPTGKTGDMGIDLVVTAYGKKRGVQKLGVQAKGWTRNVGNDAVQQAHTGKDYYNCDACAVITNSGFTNAAIELARVVGCRLIDGGEIPSLIRGRIALFED